MKAINRYTSQILLLIGCFILLSFVLLPLLNLGNKRVKGWHDGTLKVVNNDLVLDDTVVLCHFVPVVGGSIFMGYVDSLKWTHHDSTSSTVNEFNYRNNYVHSFLIGEIPVTVHLCLAVESGKLPLHNRLSMLSGLNPIQIFYKKDDVQSFIDTLNQKTGRTFRLPTNEEWEFAARGGMKSRGFKYSGSNQIRDVAWYNGNCKETHSVKKKMPNELGIYDMSGNMWECTSTPIYKTSPTLRMMHDWMDPNDENTPLLKKTLECLACRGGAWDSPEEECSLDYLPKRNFSEFCIRLVLEY